MQDENAVTTELTTSSPAATPPVEQMIVRPEVIDDQLVNPGIGFMTFQRFNGDSLNEGTGWTEGYPIEYEPFDGNLITPDHPPTSLAYFRIYWKFFQPAEGEYRFDLIDGALQTASERGQTLLLRVAPYGTGEDNDVPDWYRAIVGREPDLPWDWRTDAENPLYTQHFGRTIRALGERYDDHPLLESVDISIVGPWGEGAGSEALTDRTRGALLDAYLEAFPTTHLLALLTDEKTNGYALARRSVGWRADCLGDVGGFSSRWCHMYDMYPQQIIRSGLEDAWKTAPVSLEVCWVMQHWKDQGWDVDYIIDQSLKWHISSFNGKSSAVPEEWRPQVDRWLRSMGYRLALRRFTYPPVVHSGGPLAFTSWWENRGVAPPYHPFRVALRLKGPGWSTALPTDADIRTWLPGDSLLDGEVTVPTSAPPGTYELQIGILSQHSDEPVVKLAIAGVDSDGWYRMGPIEVVGGHELRTSL